MKSIRVKGWNYDQASDRWILATWMWPVSDSEPRVPIMIKGSVIGWIDAEIIIIARDQELFNSHVAARFGIPLPKRAFK